MDLESVADELYAASPDDFVERRTQRVAEARAAKDRALVKAIGQLRRPTRSAWLVNLLTRAEPAQVEALLDLGAELADAQRRSAGSDLRRLSAKRHAALETLTRRATEIAAEHGHAATEATRQEVTQTLQAALSDPGVAEEVRAARVVQPASYGGFGPLDLLTALAPPTPAAPVEADPGPAAEPDPEPPPGPEPESEPPVPEPEPTPEPEPEADAGPDPARLAAEAAVREAEEALERARSDADEAEEVADSATNHADDLAEQVESLRSRLADAEEAEHRARDHARTARKQLAQQRQGRVRAEEALAEARAALLALGPE